MRDHIPRHRARLRFTPERPRASTEQRARHEELCGLQTRGKGLTRDQLTELIDLRIAMRLATTPNAFGEVAG